MHSDLRLVKDSVAVRHPYLLVAKAEDREALIEARTVTEPRCAWAPG
jgi:hypothetical protein